MATRSRRRLHGGRRIYINPDLPIHHLSTLSNQDMDAIASICYSFNPHIDKLTSHPKRIDILHLLHDIYALNPFFNHNDQCTLNRIRNEIGNTKILLEDDLAHFVTFAVRKIISRYCYDADDMTHLPDAPNWMLLLYHNNLSTINSKLSVISPILALFDVETFYDEMHRYPHNQDIVSLISCLVIIRRHIPSSPLKGIDYPLLTDHYQLHDNEYIAIDYRHLFGEHLCPHLLHDLCKYIMTFLDLNSFFKCSMINSAWLHFIYHNDTFAFIYKQIAREQNQLQCELLDHSILSQVHIDNAPLTIGWTLKCDNSSYLDFVTLKNHWFQSYVDIISITLQRKNTTCHKSEWMDIKQMNKCCNEVGFDSLLMNDDSFISDNTEYRVKLQMMKPFKSRPIYSNTTQLRPQQWLLRYTEAKERDDIDETHDPNINNNRKLFNVHVFWFSFYVDLLHSMNTNVIADVLKNLRICQNRIRNNTEYLKKQYTPTLFKTMIRYLLHDNHKIKLNAMRCLRRIAIQETEELQDHYLGAFAKYGLIRICEHTLFEIRCSDNSVLCSLREQMLWFLGYYIKTGCEWKSMIFSEMSDINAFVMFVMKEIEVNRKPKYTASYIWMLSKLFSLYHQTRADDEACENHTILNAHLGKTMMKLMWKSFSNAFGKYKILHLEACEVRRRQHNHIFIEGDEDTDENKHEEVERQKQLDGWRCVLRDSYYGYAATLRYFNKEILQIIDITILKDVIGGFDLAMDGMQGSEFALRMVKTSLSSCIDAVFRLNTYNKEIFEFGFLDKLYAILDAMIVKLEFLIMIKEKKLEIDMRMMDHYEDNGAKEDEFMMLYPAIVEAIPMIANNVCDIYSDCENGSEAQSKIIKLLYLCVDVAVLHADYLNVSDEDLSLRESEIQDEICCTMAVIWDVMSRYGSIIRDYITENHKIMELIEHKWCADHNTITANQAQSLLTALQNDHVFDALFDSKKKKNNAIKDDIMSFVVFCPCGDPLKYLQAKDCYDATSFCYLYCDYCREKIDWKLNPKRMIFHCDKKENIHPHGFDLCVNCSKRKYFLDQK